MTSFGKFTLRFAAYGVIVAYLACDLFVFHGPLYHRLQAAKPDSEESIADARRRGVAARVYGREITLAQIDHAVRNRLARRGDATPESITPGQLNLHRYAALGELIDHEILRVKVMHATSEFPVSDEKIDAAYQRIAHRFSDDDAFQQALMKSGTSSAALRARLAARIQQIKFAESRTNPLASAADPRQRHRAVAEFREKLRHFEIDRDRIMIDREMLR